MTLLALTALTLLGVVAFIALVLASRAVPRGTWETRWNVLAWTDEGEPSLWDSRHTLVSTRGR